MLFMLGGHLEKTPCILNGKGYGGAKSDVILNNNFIPVCVLLAV